MSRIAVLGAGAGGRSAVVELAREGHEVALWNRRADTLAPILADSGVRHRGVLGDGCASPASVTTRLAEAVDGAEVVVVCLPALAHAEMLADLARLRVTVPILLNPGGTAGALHARAVFLAHETAQPPTAEFSTLTYVARVAPDGAVTTTSRARAVRVGCLPGHEAAADWAVRLFPGVSPAPDVVVSSLSNVNMVLHPPAAVLGVAWVEASGGDFRFYVDAMTPGVGRVLNLLDAERLTVGKAYGHVLPPLIEEMAAIGTADHNAATAGDAVAAIRGGAANSTIKAPDSLAHRYYREDLAFGLKPFVALAEVAGVAVPIASALLALGCAAAGISADVGLDRRSLAIERMTLDQLRALVSR